ncbi:phosphohistidine phosphatase SixA [Candidatus Profftia tarda]|nr:phosphohistidine phosphatase SixA [Candidatus Profftia tarda]
MRHGKAALDASHDPTRPLVYHGYKESFCMASLLTKKSYKIKKILVSPYLRAQQTLIAVCQGLAFAGNIEVLLELRPNGNIAIIMCYIYSLSEIGLENIIIISHLPLLSYLFSALCPEEIRPKFVTSSISCISFDVSTKKGILNWQMNPAEIL